MLTFLLVLLLVLWFLGYVTIPWLVIPDVTVMYILDKAVSLWDVLILIVVIWAIGILPSPFRQIAGALIVLWLLSVVGILAVAGLSNLLVLAIIVGLLVALFQR